MGDCERRRRRSGGAPASSWLSRAYVLATPTPARPYGRESARKQPCGRSGVATRRPLVNPACRGVATACFTTRRWSESAGAAIVPAWTPLPPHPLQARDCGRLARAFEGASPLPEANSDQKSERFDPRQFGLRRLRPRDVLAAGSPEATRRGSPHAGSSRRQHSHSRASIPPAIRGMAFLAAALDPVRQSDLLQSVAGGFRLLERGNATTAALAARSQAPPWLARQSPRGAVSGVHAVAIAQRSGASSRPGPHGDGSARVSPGRNDDPCELEDGRAGESEGVRALGRRSGAHGEARASAPAPGLSREPPGSATPEIPTMHWPPMSTCPPMREKDHAPLSCAAPRVNPACPRPQ